MINAIGSSHVITAAQGNDLTTTTHASGSSHGASDPMMDRPGTGNTPGPWAEGYQYYPHDSDSSGGGMSGPGGVSKPGVGSADDGGFSDQKQQDFLDSMDGAWNPESTLKWLGKQAGDKFIDGLSSFLGAAAGGPFAKFVLGYEDDMGGKSIGAQENRQASGHGASSSSGGSSTGGAGDHPSGGGVDYGKPSDSGSSGSSGNAGSSGGSGSTAPATKTETTKKPTVSNDGMEVNGESTTQGTNEPINNDPPPPGPDDDPNKLPGNDGEGGGRPNTIGGHETYLPGNDGGGGTPNTINLGWNAAVTHSVNVGVDASVMKRLGLV